MNWSKLESLEQLQAIKQDSNENAVLIFKHSTRCSVSRTVLDRLERNWKADEMVGVTPFFLDLLSHRDISDQVAEDFATEHESPQVLIIRNGRTVYDSSHLAIQYRDLVLRAQQPEARS